MRNFDTENEKDFFYLKMIKNVRENFSNLWKLFPRVTDVQFSLVPKINSQAYM